MKGEKFFKFEEHSGDECNALFVDPTKIEAIFVFKDSDYDEEDCVRLQLVSGETVDVTLSSFKLFAKRHNLIY